MSLQNDLERVDCCYILSQRISDFILRTDSETVEEIASLIFGKEDLQVQKLKKLNQDHREEIKMT